MMPYNTAFAMISPHLYNIVSNCVIEAMLI